MKRFKKIKNLKPILLTILICLCVINGVLFIKNNNYITLYISPETNTSTYPYISKVSNKINKVLFEAAKNLRTNCPDAKIVYTNGFGSGFLKNNITSSDYDYSAGVYLGKYEYNGSNSQELANKILKNIYFYQANIYSIAKSSGEGFYIEKPPLQKASDAGLMAASIQKALKGTPYSMKLQNTVFLLKPDEIILPNYNVMRIYNKDISYYPEYRKILRELTANIDYYIDITDTQNGKTRHIALITCTANGQRPYQIEFRHFVPNIYTNISSFNYAKNITNNLDDDEYFNLILTNYFHHFKLLSYGNSQLSENPLKAVKRLLQCADILTPVLPKDSAEQIKTNSYNIIKSTTIALINDYYTANEILYKITETKSFYDELEKNKEVSGHIQNMESILNGMINDPEIQYGELKPLFEYQRDISHAKTNISALQNIIKNKYSDTNHYIEKLMFAKMPDNKKLGIHITYLNKVLEAAGIYNIKLYKNNNDHIYIFKDNFTAGLNLKTINQLNIINGDNTRIYDNNTKFEFMNPEDFYGDTKQLSYGWITNRQTTLQNTIYKDLREYIIKDKSRYHLRIRLGIQRKNSWHKIMFLIE